MSERSSPLLFANLVFTEPGIGSYVAVELPDQAAVLATGGIVARQDIIESRLVLRAAF